VPVGISFEETRVQIQVPPVLTEVARLGGMHPDTRRCRAEP
jgi:hypothetical protein